MGLYDPDRSWTGRDWVLVVLMGAALLGIAISALVAGAIGQAVVGFALFLVGIPLTVREYRKRHR